MPVGPGGLAYRLPPLQRRLSAADARHLVAHYDGAVTYSDLWIGLFLEEMGRRGLRDNTLFAVSGDHGESLGEHGRYEHGYHLFDVNLHVPLVLSGPGVPAGKKRSRSWPSWPAPRLSPVAEQVPRPSRRP